MLELNAKPWPIQPQESLPGGCQALSTVVELAEEVEAHGHGRQQVVAEPVRLELLAGLTCLGSGAMADGVSDRGAVEEVAKILVNRPFGGHFRAVLRACSIGSKVAAYWEAVRLAPLGLMETGMLFEGGHIIPTRNSVSVWEPALRSQQLVFGRSFILRHAPSMAGTADK